MKNFRKVAATFFLGMTTGAMATAMLINFYFNHVTAAQQMHYWKYAEFAGGILGKKAAEGMMKLGCKKNGKLEVRGVQGWDKAKELLGKTRTSMGCKTWLDFVEKFADEIEIGKDDKLATYVYDGRRKKHVIRLPQSVAEDLYRTAAFAVHEAAHGLADRTLTPFASLALMYKMGIPPQIARGINPKEVVAEALADALQYDFIKRLEADRGWKNVVPLQEEIFWNFNRLRWGFYLTPLQMPEGGT